MGGGRIGDSAMPIELTAHTTAGARLIALAEDLSAQLAARAAEHDRDGSYPFEAIDALKAARYFAAPIPIDLGGLGAYAKGSNGTQYVVFASVPTAPVTRPACVPALPLAQTMQSSFRPMSNNCDAISSKQLT